MIIESCLFLKNYSRFSLKHLLRLALLSFFNPVYESLLHSLHYLIISQLWWELVCVSSCRPPEGFLILAETPNALARFHVREDHN